MAEILDIVDEHDNVIGQAPRDEAHQKGLRIRLVYVWFYTNDKKVFLQRRSRSKEAYPGRLVSTVSGHVPSGMSYIEAAIKETAEETGVHASAEQLAEENKVYKRSVTETGDITSGFRTSYTCMFDGGLNQLRVEAIDGGGFEVWDAAELLRATKEMPDKFSPFLLHDASQAILRKIAA